MKTRILRHVLLFSELILLSLLFAPKVYAATFTVTNTNDSGAGTLRQAILDANANPGLDTITFNIPGAGPFSIKPLSALPAIEVYPKSWTQPMMNNYNTAKGLNHEQTSYVHT